MDDCNNTSSVVVVILVACIVSACIILLVLFINQRVSLRQMTRDLRNYNPETAKQVTITSRSRSVINLANSINGILEEQKTARERTLRTRRRFNEDLAALSHDIRTPLAGVQGYLSLFQKTPDPEQKNRYLISALEKLTDIRAMVDDLFEYTKYISAMQIPELKTIHLFSSVTQALLSQYPAFSERMWEPCVDFDNENLCVTAPAGYIDRICANLTMNALRHASTAPRITLRESLLTYQNEVANPRAIDVDRLFERFYRADNSRKGPGSGLGLAIVAQLCADMDVPIQARIEGNCFIVEIDFSGIVADDA